MRQLCKNKALLNKTLLQKSKKIITAFWLLCFLVISVQQAKSQTCYGVSATGGDVPANAVGAPNGTVCSVQNPLIVDMGTTPLSTGASITFYASGAAFFTTPTVAVSQSLDGVSFSNTNTLNIGTSIIPVVYTLVGSARYLKFEQGGAVFPAQIDAVTFTCPVPACAAPVLTVTVTQATCQASGDANSDGTLTLATFDANAKKVDYNIGSTYTGAGFASATSITGTSNFVVTSNLPNPTINQPYTLRVFCDATTYTDKTVFLTPKQCKSSDMNVSVSPATQSGSLGELLTYTVTLSNAGPNINTNVKVKVPMPPTTSATLLSATAAIGTYDALTNLWSIASVPVGSTTLTFTLKVN